MYFTLDVPLHEHTFPINLILLHTGCDNFFRKSIFLVGEIGGNDYNYPFFVGGSIKQVQALVPLVVEAITKAASVR